jgi:hypothetical protein
MMIPRAWQLVHDLTEAFQYYLIKSTVKPCKGKRCMCTYSDRTKYAQGILPIDTYKKDIDEIVANELKYDWESLRALVLEVRSQELNTVRTNAFGEQFRCVKRHKRNRTS